MPRAAGLARGAEVGGEWAPFGGRRHDSQDFLLTDRGGGFHDVGCVCRRAPRAPARERTCSPRPRRPRGGRCFSTARPWPAGTATTARPSGRGRSRTALLKSVGTEGNYGSDKRADLVTDREFTDFELSVDWKATQGWQQRRDVRGGRGQEVRRRLEDGTRVPVHRRRRLPPEARGVAEGRRELRHAPPRREQKHAEAGRRVEQHEDRGERRARRALAEREEDPRVRALDARVEEAARLRQVEGSAGLRQAKTGRIALQDHGSVFWFRNVKVRSIQ